MSGSGEAGKGIFGGTFNPPHIAHLIVARVVHETLDLESVSLIPTATHAFKGEAEAGPLDRTIMAELAVAGDDALEVDRIEIQRGGTSYTIDTLRALGEREPDTRWHLILGEDNLDEIDDWRENELLPEVAEIVVVTRGASAVRSRPRLPFDGRCTFVPVPRLEISSTAIRRRIRRGLSVRYWVPAAVEAYIGEKSLYRSEP